MRANHLTLGLLVVAIGACRPAPAPPPVGGVRPGIEVLLTDSAYLVRGRRVGLLTNHSGVDRLGRRDVDLLRAAPDVRVVALFSPEHGFRGSADRPDLPDDVDSVTGLPIYSLYTGARVPDLRALDSLDLLLVDLQDVGARYYTHVWYAVFLMRALAPRGTPVVILDRPNPLGGSVVQGNIRTVVAPKTQPVGFLPVAMRHGMTIGELARLANDVLDIGARLIVVPAAGWRRTMYYDETGLPWVRPSPNLPDLESAMHYAGLCLFEGTNLSVGRGTDRAFRIVGAPWLDPDAVLDALRGGSPSVTAGVEIQATRFTPRAPGDAKYDGVPLRGVELHVTDRARYDPPRVAVALLAAIRAAHPDSFAFRRDWFDLLAADSALRRALETATPLDSMWAVWRADRERFNERRAKYLLY